MIYVRAVVWALVLKDTGQLVGCMGYYVNLESSIGINEGEEEVGYCTEASREMID